MKYTKCDKLLTVRVPSDLIEAIKAAAKKERRTFPDFIRITLEDATNASKANR